MKIAVGTYVICLLRNSIVAEGTVEEWSDDQCVLKSADKKNLIILPDPRQDIIMIKVILDESKPIAKPPAPVTKTQIANTIMSIRDQFNHISHYPPSDLRNQKLAQLKILLIEEEKKEIAEKLRNHHIGQVKETSYGTPGFLPQQKSK